MNNNFLKLLLGLTGLGTLVDGYMTMITLLHLFKEANLLATIFAVVGGAFVWILTANIKETFGGASPLGIKILGVIAIIIDLITSYVGSIYYVAMGNSYNAPIDFPSVGCCNLANLPQTLVAVGLAIAFLVSTITIVDIWEKIRTQN